MDGGGPRKEYFRLLCRSIREESGAFFNHKNVVNFRPNVSLFHDRRFYLIGVMLATSILHGGPAFPFFPKVIILLETKWQLLPHLLIDVAYPETLQILSMVHRFAMYLSVCKSMCITLACICHADVRYIIGDRLSIRLYPNSLIIPLTSTYACDKSSNGFRYWQFCHYSD